MNKRKLYIKNSKRKNSKNISIFHNESLNFFENIDGIKNSYHIVKNASKIEVDKERRELDSLLRKTGVDTIFDAIKEAKGNKEERKKAIESITEDKLNAFVKFIQSDNLETFTKVSKRLKKNKYAEKIVPQSLIVSMVSQFDALVGGLLKSCFLVKNEMLNGSDRTLKASEILGMNSIEDTKEYLIEKEVESVLRKNHREQIDYISEKLKIPLKNDLDIWPTFVEITERRNLFVHCNGHVSSQYIKICKDEKVSLSKDIDVGVKLMADSDYFKKVYECILEMGIKLSHVVWSKMIPSERGMIQESLISISYDLLYEEEYYLSRKVIDFFLGNKFINDGMDKSTELVLKVNLAQTYKWAGNSEKSNEIVDKFDYDVLSDMFKLACSVLKDDFEKSAVLMKKIGSDGEISKEYYSEWPLFKEFRKTEHFKNAYKKIFDKKSNLKLLKDNNKKAS